MGSTRMARRAGVQQARSVMFNALEMRCQPSAETELECFVMGISSFLHLERFAIEHAQCYPQRCRGEDNCRPEQPPPRSDVTFLNEGRAEMFELRAFWKNRVGPV